MVVIAELAEVGLAPNAQRIPHAPGRPIAVLIYRWELSEDELATIRRAAGLARMQPAYGEGPGIGRIVP